MHPHIRGPQCATECGGPHSHRPTPGRISRLTIAYAAANVTNPDGTTGIHFIPDCGQGGPFTGGSLITGRADGNLDFTFDDAGGGFGEASAYHESKLANFDANRNGYFSYALILHRFVDLAAVASNLPAGKGILALRHAQPAISRTAQRWIRAYTLPCVGRACVGQVAAAGHVVEEESFAGMMMTLPISFARCNSSMTGPRPTRSTR